MTHVTLCWNSKSCCIERLIRWRFLMRLGVGRHVIIPPWWNVKCGQMIKISQDSSYLKIPLADSPPSRIFRVVSNVAVSLSSGGESQELGEPGRMTESGNERNKRIGGRGIGLLFTPPPCWVRVARCQRRGLGETMHPPPRISNPTSLTTVRTTSNHPTKASSSSQTARAPRHFSVLGWVLCGHRSAVSPIVTRSSLLVTSREHNTFAETCTELLQFRKMQTRPRCRRCTYHNGLCTATGALVARELAFPILSWVNTQPLSTRMRRLRNELTVHESWPSFLEMTTVTRYDCDVCVRSKNQALDFSFYEFLSTVYLGSARHSAATFYTHWLRAQLVGLG